MSYAGQILALDLARVTGFAVGRPGEIPRSGSVIFAKEGASMAAVLSACRAWLRQFLLDNPAIQLVVFEAPLLPMFKRGKTTIVTIRQLMGLCGTVEEFLYSKGGYDIREARVADVRIHFLGSNKHKREEAKRLTVAMCRARGWIAVDDNAADALALWDYQATLLARRVDVYADADR